MMTRIMKLKLDESNMTRNYNFAIAGLVVLILILHPFIGHAQGTQQTGEIERVCRVKAKEVAALTYKNCVTDTKNSQIEKLNKDFSKKIKAVKDEYEQELARISGKKIGSKSSKISSTSDSKNSVMSKSSDEMSTQEEGSMDLPEPIPVETSDSSI